MELTEVQKRLMTAELNKYTEELKSQGVESELKIPAEQMDELSDTITEMLTSTTEARRDEVGVAMMLSSKFPGRAIDALNVVLYPNNPKLPPDVNSSADIRRKMYIAGANLDIAVCKSYEDFGNPNKKYTERLNAATNLRNGLVSLAAQAVGEAPSNPLR